MEEAMVAGYWCHMCSRMVNPILEAEIKCPYCESGFIQEMSSITRDTRDSDGDFGSDRALSLWAPILLGMMGNNRRRRRFRRLGFEDEDDDTEEGEWHHGVDAESDREIESIIRRRRRSSATILRLLRDARAGIASESENGDYSNQNSNLIGSLGDYFVGPGLDLLLQHLAENDPNGHGTPPARKEAIEAMPTVKMAENVQCSVCLDDLQIGAEAKEMPCKHKFHSGCILPWLELHSSCPVCRFQLPIDESKTDADGSRNGNDTGERESESESESARVSVEEGEGNRRNENGRSFQCSNKEEKRDPMSEMEVNKQVNVPLISLKAKAMSIADKICAKAVSFRRNVSLSLATVPKLYLLGRSANVV
ncbi:hypothetical protein NL676_005636 [Syzygium grande]|nr:hypothetical protein NL676_005636 [Syzygium grande]